MRIGIKSCLSAIVLTGVIFATGCAYLKQPHDPKPAVSDSADRDDMDWGQSIPPESKKSKQPSAFFFNDKAYEIDEHLGR